MKYKGIIITGTSGAGKSIVSRALCTKDEIFQIVPAVTTRKKRRDGDFSQYQYVTDEEFKKLDNEGKLLISSEYRNSYYGITNEAFKQVINEGKIPLLIITPESVKKLLVKEGHAFLTFFLDGLDNLLDDRLKHRGEKISEEIKKQRIDDRKYTEEYANDEKNYIYFIKSGNTAEGDEVVELIYYLWNLRNTGGMLPKEIIKLMIKCGMLLENAVIDKIQGASYDLSLGEEYFHDGNIKTLTDKKPFIEMEPGDYVLVSSKETANLPKDIAGRFDITVGLFCRGVILSNGPQIDPGFRGKLFCLLFNTSNENLQLKLGEHFATIEFIKLIGPTIPYSGKYQNKLKIKDYLPAMVETSAINKLFKEVEDLKRERWWIKILPLIISIFALLLVIWKLIGW